MPAPLLITETRHGEALLLALAGAIDTLNAPAFETRLTELIGEGQRRLVLDCGSVDYVNSAGLKGFLVAAKALDAQGGKLALCGLSSSVRMIFDLIGFSQIMTILPTAEEALLFVTAPPVPG